MTAIAFLLVLALGTAQVALLLYGRNVVLNAAHEAARTLVERGASGRDAVAVARRAIERAAGGLVDGLQVSVSTRAAGDAELVVVELRGRLDPPGPIPYAPGIRARAGGLREGPVE